MLLVELDAVWSSNAMAVFSLCRVSGTCEHNEREVAKPRRLVCALDAWSCICTLKARKSTTMSYTTHWFQAETLQQINELRTGADIAEDIFSSGSFALT